MAGVHEGRGEGDDRCGKSPGTRNQLDGIEAETDQEVAFVDDRLFDRRVREHAAEPGIVVREDAFGLVGHQRGNSIPSAQFGQVKIAAKV